MKDPDDPRPASGESKEDLFDSEPTEIDSGLPRSNRQISPDSWTFAPGAVIADRYQIVRRIARGGMGEVYEAEDRTLRTNIALKVIRSETAKNPQAEARFKREVQLAREVSHPNVCRLHDVGLHKTDEGNVLFLTMELLAGASLRDILVQDGPMTPDRALPVVESMALALDAAHQVGVIHRDFKSANVVIEDSGESKKKPRVVVTDFGLARHFPNQKTQQTISDTGEVVGTPAYMAPEQVEGEQVTSAADIYAFGIVLYELVTGFRPFDGGSPFSIAARRLTELPTPPSHHRPDLPPVWESVILGCLARDPNQRYPTASAAALALREGDSSEDETMSVGKVRAGADQLGSPRQPRHRIVWITRSFAALGIAIVVLAGALGTHRLLVDTKSEDASTVVSIARPTIAVLEFENLTGSSETQWVATALAELLTTEMGANGELRTLGGHEVARVRQDMGSWDGNPTTEHIARLHRQLGADLVVTGSFSLVGMTDDGLLRVDLRLVDAATDAVVEEGGATGTPRQLFELLERASEPLRIAAGIGSLSPSESIAVRATWPSDPEAARLLADGLEFFRLSDFAASRDRFERAAAIEPEQPLIQVMLARSLDSLGFRHLASEAVEIAQANSSGLPTGLRQTIEASAFEIEGDLNRAIEIYQEIFRFHPDDLEIGLRLVLLQINISDTRAAEVTLEKLKMIEGPVSQDPRLRLASMEILRRQGNLDEALVEVQAAADSSDAAGSKSISATARLRAAEILHQLGRIDEAQIQLVEAQHLFGSLDNNLGQGQALEAAAQLAYQRGDLATAARLQNRALEIYERLDDRLGTARVRHNLGVIGIDQGNLEGAEVLFNQALDTYREIGAFANAAASELDIGVSYHIGGQLRAAEARYRSALDLYSEADDNTGTAMALTNIGEILYLRGDIDGSRKLHEEALALNTEIGDPSAIAYDTYRLGMVFAAGGDLVVARSRFESAISTQEDLGEAISVALTQLALAEMELTEGRPAEAEELARRAEEVFRVEGAPDLAGMAQSILAHILLANGQPEAAKELAEQSRTAAESSSDQLLRFAATIAVNRVRGITGEDVEIAITVLEKVADDAGSNGYTQVKLEALLALAEVLRAAGEVEASDIHLVSVIEEAQGHGLGQIVNRARDVR